MTEATITEFDVLGIGNAIVDVLARADDDFLAEWKIEKGAMNLVSAERAEAIYAAMGPAVEVSGGSAANSITGVAALGGRAAFIGKVADDLLGEVFAHDIAAAGVTYRTAPLVGGVPTARSFILVTPDAQRSMNTYLGACQELGPDDIDEDLVKGAKLTYLEGYLWDPPRAKEAFKRAAAIARAAGRRTAITLSDAFCVDRYRDEFLDLVQNHVDVLVANEHELMSLFQVDDFEAAMHEINSAAEIAVLTRSAKGSVILAGDEKHIIPAQPTKVEDTTGAGDLYAGGFFFGLTRGLDLADCGRIASICAAEVISHVGARPEHDLKKLVKERAGIDLG